MITSAQVQQPNARGSSRRALPTIAPQGAVVRSPQTSQQQQQSGNPVAPVPGGSPGVSPRSPGLQRSESSRTPNWMNKPGMSRPGSARPEEDQDSRRMMGVARNNTEVIRSATPTSAQPAMGVPIPSASSAGSLPSLASQGTPSPSLSRRLPVTADGGSRPKLGQVYAPASSPPMPSGAPPARPRSMAPRRLSNTPPVVAQNLEQSRRRIMAKVLSLFMCSHS